MLGDTIDLVILMKVFYLDSFLFLNLAVDYLLLLLTAKLTGVITARISLLFSAILGTVFSTGMFFYTGGIIGMALLNCVAVWIMISMSFASISVGKRIRLCGVLLIQAFGLSGLLSLLQNLGMGKVTVQNGVPYIQIELWQILLSATGAYILFRICFKDQSLKLEKKRVAVRIKIGEKQLKTFLLTDSGNLLREPMSGNPVILLAPGVMAQLLPEGVGILLMQERWDAAELMSLLVEENFTARLVPFSTMGESGGITVAVKPNDITVGTDGKRGKTAEYWVGIARNDIDVCGGCRGLIGI